MAVVRGDVFDQWAQAVAVSLLADLPPGDVEPVDLEPLLTKRRVQRVTDAAIKPDGMLVPHKGGFEVKIRSETSTSRARRRWTIAHELAHTYFYAYAESFPRKSWPRDLPQGADEERLCDLVAEYLLMPKRPLELAAHTIGPTIDGLRSIAERFHVSIRALSRALHERELWHFLFFAVRRDRDEYAYRLDWAVGGGGLRLFANMHLESSSVSLARCLSGRAGYETAPFRATVARHLVHADVAHFAAVRPGRSAFCLIPLVPEAGVSIARTDEPEIASDQLSLNLAT